MKKKASAAAGAAPSNGSSLSRPTRSQLMNEIAALTSFANGNEQQNEAFDDGTAATDAVETKGRWVMEDGDDEEVVAQQQRSKLRLAAGMDFQDDRRYKGKRIGRQALAALRGDSDSEGGEEEEEEEERGMRTAGRDGFGMNGRPEDEEEEETSEDEEQEEDGDDDDEEEEDDDDDVLNGGEGEGRDGEEEEEGDDDDDDDDGSDMDDDEESSSISSSVEQGDEEDGMGWSSQAATVKEKKSSGAGSRLSSRHQGEEVESMRLLAQRSTEERWARAEAAQQQREGWNRLLEMRILLQPLVGLANRMPRGEVFTQYRESHAEVASGLGGIVKGLQDTLAGLLTMRSLQQQGGGAVGNKTSTSSFHAGKKRKLEELENGQEEELWEEAVEEYEAGREQWRAVLDRTHQRVCLTSAGGGAMSSSKKFKAVNQGLWQQVEASMRADVDRRQRKCHLLVGQAKHIGATSSPPEEDKEEEEGVNSSSSSSNEVDLEAYDDTDLYQLLLREFMENTGEAAGGADPLWLMGGGAGSKKKGASKKKVDTKASKGRKMRYAVHPKLEHFMFPVPLGFMPMDMDMLFASLPGRKAKG